MAWCGIIVPYEVFPADVDPTQASLPLPTLTLLIDRVDTEKSRINILSDIDVSMFYYIKIPFSSMPDWWPDIKSVELARDSQVIASLFIANGGLEMRMLPVISGGGGSLPPGNILIDASFTPINAIPVYSGLTGEVSSSSSSSPATLPRPLAITTTEENALILTTDQIKSIIKLVNSNPGSNRSSVDYDGIFEAGSDSTGFGASDYFIYNILTAQQVLNISSSDSLVRALTGFVSSRYDITTSASNPGNATTLWNKTGTDPGLYLGANKLALNSNLITQTTWSAIFVVGGTAAFPTVSTQLTLCKTGSMVVARLHRFSNLSLLNDMPNIGTISGYSATSTPLPVEYKPVNSSSAVHGSMVPFYWVYDDNIEDDANNGARTGAAVLFNGDIATYNVMKINFYIRWSSDPNNEDIDRARWPKNGNKVSALRDIYWSYFTA